LEYPRISGDRRVDVRNAGKTTSLSPSEDRVEFAIFSHLNDEFVWDRFEEGRFVVLGPDNVGWPGTDRLSLKIRDSSAVLFALATSRIVTLHAVQEILTTARVSDVFGSDADFLLFDPISDRLGNNHAQRAVCHVENATGASVVVLVGHTRVNGSICFDVDDIADFVDL